MKLVVLLILFITLVYGEYVNPPTTFKSIKLTQSPSAGLKDTLLYLDSGILKKGSAPNGDTVTAGTGITVNHITGSFQVALYQPAITGSGVANYIAKWGSVSSLGYSSLIYDNGTNVGIGTTNPTHKLDVQGGYITALQSGGTAQAFMEGDVGISYFGNLDTGDIYLGNSNNWGYLVVKNGGNVGIGTTKPDSQLTTKGGIHDSGGLHVEGCSLLKDTVKIGDQSNYGITAYNSKFDLVDAHHTSAALDNDNISGLIGYDFLSNSEDSSLFFGVKDIDENNFYGLAINTSHLYASFNIPLSVDSLNVSDKIIYQGSPLFDSGACPCSLYFASTLEVVSTVHYFIANNVATLMIYPMNAIGPGSVHIKVRVPSKLASTYVLDVPGIIADGGNTEIGLIEIAGREIELFTSGRDFLSAGTCGTGLANGMGSTVITYPLK